MSLKKILIPLSIALFTSNVQAQTVPLGAPDSWLNQSISDLVFETMPVVDVTEQLEIDSVNKANGFDKVLRFGYEHHTNINVFENGKQFVNVNNERVTQLGVECPNAISINIIFDEFELAEGALLYVYNDDKTQFIGAHSSNNNNPNRSLGIDLIYDSKLVIEVIEPQNVIGQSSLVLGTVVHGYKDLAEIAYQFQMKGLNTSGDCNVDVNCPAGDGWERQRDGVAILVAGGGFCSGSLINCTTNTDDNITPYFLTANHCNQNNVVNAVFRFRWEAPENGISCATILPSTNGLQNKNVNGAQFKANNVNSDFLLVELNNLPDANWNVYYSGWDISGNDEDNAVGIHHPDGDIKKISIENDPLTKIEQFFNGGQGSFWRIADWDVGVTEPGSSGSPLLNNDKRIIGVLSAGQAACNGTNDNNLYDIYGRLDVAWDDLPSPADQLKHWLDPNNSGVETLDGLASNVGIFENKINELAFSIYPNPNNGSFDLELGEINVSKKITLFNALGEIIKVVETTESTFHFDSGEIAKGVYLVQLNIGNSTGIQRLVVQ